MNKDAVRNNYPSHLTAATFFVKLLSNTDIDLNHIASLNGTVIHNST